MYEYNLRYSDLVAIRAILKRLHDRRAKFAKKSDAKNMRLLHIFWGITAAIAGLGVVDILLPDSNVKQYGGLTVGLMLVLLFVGLMVVCLTVATRETWATLKGRYLRSLEMRERYEAINARATRRVSKMPLIAIQKCLADNRSLRTPDRQGLGIGAIIAAITFAITQIGKYVDHTKLQALFAHALPNMFPIVMIALAPAAFLYGFRFMWNIELRADTGILELAETIALSRIGKAPTNLNMEGTTENAVEAPEIDDEQDDDNDDQDDERTPPEKSGEHPRRRSRHSSERNGIWKGHIPKS